MDIKAVMPPKFRDAALALGLSPAIISGDHVFFSGVTGSGTDGRMPDDPAKQIEAAFDKVEVVLLEAGLSFRSVVEMTTYHVGLREHFDVFNTLRLMRFTEPHPAWTAVEVAGLRREGAIVELRLIARIGEQG